MRKLVATTLVALLVTGQPVATSAAAPVIDTPDGPTWYLALGDSLAAGYQPIGDPEDGRRTQMGYVDQLWLLARQWYPDLQLLNLGCPGSDTQKLMAIVPDCPYPHGSQLDEAVAFLEAHRDAMAFITIDIGFADFPCTDDISCIAPGLDSIHEHLPLILGALRAAAPGTPIVGMNVYDPYLGSWLAGEQDTARLSVAAVQFVNDHLEEVYAEAGVVVADVEGAFATDDFETQVPLAGHGLVPRNVALVCLRTWLCFPPPLGPDRHPNALGFRVMADAFATELGFPGVAPTAEP